MTTFNRMQQLKRRFFAMRNGAVADSLRRAGAPYRIIFGLNLPQLVEIAQEFGTDREMALELRDNEATRESQLIAPMLFPRDELSCDLALSWLKGAMTPEVVDVACLKLIRYLDRPREVIDRLMESGKALERYAALRLGANILPAEMDVIEAYARRELASSDPMTVSLCRMLIDDIEWRRDDAQ